MIRIHYPPAFPSEAYLQLIRPEGFTLGAHSIHGRSELIQGWTGPRQRRLLEHFFLTDSNWDATWHVTLTAPSRTGNCGDVKTKGVRFLRAFRRTVPNQFPMAENNRAHGCHFLTQGINGDLQFHFTFDDPRLEDEETRDALLMETWLRHWQCEFPEPSPVPAVTRIPSPRIWVRGIFDGVDTRFDGASGVPRRLWNKYGRSPRVKPSRIIVGREEALIRCFLSHKETINGNTRLSRVLRYGNWGMSIDRQRLDEILVTKATR